MAIAGMAAYLGPGIYQDDRGNGLCCRYLVMSFFIVVGHLSFVESSPVYL